MKRCILVDSRISKDEKSGDTFLNLTCYQLASKMKDGKLWHQKKSDAIINCCIKKETNQENFDKYSKVLPGSLIDIEFYINDYTNKSAVRILDVVKGTMNLYSTDQLYI